MLSLSTAWAQSGPEMNVEYIVPTSDLNFSGYNCYKIPSSAFLSGAESAKITIVGYDTPAFYIGYYGTKLQENGGTSYTCTSSDLAEALKGNFYFFCDGSENVVVKVLNIKKGSSTEEEDNNPDENENEKDNDTEGGNSGNTPTLGFAEVGVGTVFSQNENVYTLTGNAETMIEGAVVTIISDGTDINCHLKENLYEDWKRALKTFTLTPEDVTKLAANDYVIYVLAWNCTVSNITLSTLNNTPEDEEDEEDTTPYDKDRTKAFGYEFTNAQLKKYPQLTDVPTVYLNVYAPDSYDTGEYANNDIKTGTPQTLAANYQLAANTKITEKKYNWYYQTQIIVRDDNGKMKERNELTTVRGRGNSTWRSSSKKPLRLKFPSKTRFLATSAEDKSSTNAKSWTLLANDFDKSMLRNGLTHELVDYINKVDNANNLPFNPACQYVDLVVNGEYWGTYQISDQVQVGSGRVDIDEDNGWFVEYTINNNGFVEEPFLKIGSSYVNIKNPEDPNVVDGDPNSTAHIDDNKATTNPIYNDLKTMLNNLHTGINSIVDYSEKYASSDWMQYIDTRSLVDWFIAMDITGNWDGDIANDYLYKDVNDKKLKVGPLWDIDLGYGNYQDAKKHFYEQGQGIKYSIEAMLKDPYFVKKLYERWQQIYNNGALTTYLNNKVSALSGTLTNTQAKNYEKWSLGSNGLGGKTYSTYQAAVDAVVTFNNTQIPWLEEEYKRLYDSMGCADLEDIADDDEDNIDDTPIASTEIEQKIANKEQLTNLATVYLTVPDALNEDGTRKDINSVVFKKNGVADYHAASIEVVDNGTDGTGRQIVLEHDDKLNIKVRGNETAKEGVTKLPYRLKFEKDDKDPITGEVLASHKYDMLGLGYKKRNWVLLANKNDGTLMHNALAYTIGKAVGMEFCPGYKFVDLVINGEYRGNYQISDHCEVDKNRINVDADNGWYLEANGNSQWEEPYVNPTGLYISIKSPEPDTNSAEETQLKNDVLSYFNNCTALFDIWNDKEMSEEKQAALTDPNTGWRKYWDEESLINYYIGVNVTGNHDGFMTVKMYRNPGEKVKFGPLWDFDTSYGNYDDGKTLSEDAQLGSPIFCNFIHKLVKYDPVFVKKIHDKLHEVIDAGLQKGLLDEVDKLEVMLSKSQATENPNQQSGAYATSVQGLRDYINAHLTWLVETIDAKYEDMGGDDIVIPETPEEGDDDTPTGDLGALVDLGDDKYSYTGSASTFKEGTEITITTSTEGTTLSNYITEGTQWNTTKTITLSAADVTTLASSENKYTFFMQATGGEVKAVNVKVPVSTSTGAEFNKEYVSSYTSGDFVVPASNFNANATSIKVILKNNLSNYTDGWNGNYGFNGHPWKAAYSWTTTNTCEIIVTYAEDIQSVAQYGMGITGPKDLTVTVINYGSSSDSGDTTPTYTLTLSASEGGTVTGAGTYAEGTTVLIKAIPNDGYKFVKWSDDNTYASRSVTLKDADITLTATFAAEGSTDEDPFNEQGTRKQLTGIPTIYIDTNAAVGDSWGAATLDIYDSEGKLNSASWKSKSVSIQYQGSGSGGKDSYRLKFEKKTQMMDSGSFKQWVLLANDDDPTMLNNALAKVIGDAVGMPYTPGCQFVDLYVNNTYMGTYQLTDRVKAELGRSLIADGDNTYDWHVRFNDDGELAEDNPATTDYIAGSTKMPNIIIKNPDPDDYHTNNDEAGLAALKSTMSEYFTTVFATDASGNYTNIADYVDKDQLVAWYIAQEILGIYKGFSSVEAYRSVTSATDQKLHFGPLWDNEKGFGNTGEVTAPDNTTDLNNDATHNGLMISWSAYPMMKSLFTNLWTQPWFKTAVKTKWEEISGTLPSSLSQTITTLSGTIAESQALNAQKWNNSLGDFQTYDAALAATNAYITNRFAYLDKKFAVLAEGACEHTYTSSQYADNGDGTHSPKCDKCDYVNTEEKNAHNYTAKEGHPYCDICKATESATIEGSVNDDTKVYRIHESEKATNIKYVAAESNFTPSGNKIYICDQEITEETNNLTNVVWPRSADTDYNGNEIVLTDGDYTYDQKASMHVKTASYTRSMSSTWGTLCLPFKVKSCNDYTLYEIADTKIGEDNQSGTIVFSEIAEASGLVPVVFRKNTSAGSVTFHGVAQTKEGADNGLVTVKKSKKLGNADALLSTGVEGSGTWKLYGNVKKSNTTAEITPDFSNVYYIASNKFWQADGNVNVATFRAVFVFTPTPGNEAAAKTFSIAIHDDTTTGIKDNIIDKNLAIFTGNGRVILNSNYDTKVSIYNINGTSVVTTYLEKDAEKSFTLPKGMYIINGTKVVVK